jgi:RNA polymerase sigma-70 factor (ECF subfamily)
MKRTSLKEKFLIFKVRQKKDPKAFGELYDYYVKRIYRFILFKVATPEEAEDLTSEVFLKTWEYINKTNKVIKNINALFYRVARNCVIDYYRSRVFETRMTDMEQMKQIQDKRDLALEVEVKMDVEKFSRDLRKLKDIYREAILLKYVEDFSISDIAEIMDKSNANVRVLLHRALKALKEVVGEEDK